MSKKLEGKTAVITGATSGIGKAVVERFAREGANIVFCGRRREPGEELEKRLLSENYNVKFVQADCTVDSDMEKLIETAVTEFKTIDILFNNSGVMRYFSFEDMDMKRDYDEVFDTNVRSYFLTAKLAVKHMLAQGSGIIINNASIGALNGGPIVSSYCSSKGAVLQFTRSIAKEFGARGIRVNAISPGLIYTEMMQKGTEFVTQAEALIPMGRGGTVEEIANAMVFLACEDSSFCNGMNLVVDGGASA